MSERGDQPKGATNFKRRGWDKAEYEARAKERQRVIEEAVRSGADESEVTARIMEAESLVGAQGRGAAGSAEDLRERAIRALAATGRDAGPDGSERAWLQRRDFGISMDDKIGTRKMVTEGTSLNNRGGFYVPVTGVTLRNSLSFLDHINGRKYNTGLGYSMRVEKKSASEVAAKLRAINQEKAAATEASEVMTAARATGEDLSRAAYDVRVQEAELEEESRRAKERERRKRRKEKKRAAYMDDNEDEPMVDPSMPAPALEVADSASAPIAAAHGSSSAAAAGAAQPSSSPASSSSSSSRVAASYGSAAALVASIGELRRSSLNQGVYGIGPTSGMVDIDLAGLLGVSAAPVVPWNSSLLGAS